jgi:DNA-directed RNA polymerase
VNTNDGVTKFGAGEQVYEDTRELSDYHRDKDKLWAVKLGDLLYETCYEKLPGPASMLRLFESLAVMANEREEFLRWSVPLTNFPVVQAYTKPTIKQIRLHYGSDVLSLSAQDWSEQVLNKSGAVAGASPNIIHSFDAAHLMKTLDDAPYRMVCIHDSFGTTPGNAEDLFMRIRLNFAEFYLGEPLVNLLEQHNALHLMPGRGDLNLMDIVRSDYAFV